MPNMGGRIVRLGASSGIAALAVFARETAIVRIFGGTPIVDAFYLSIAPLALCMLTFTAVAEIRLVPLLAEAPHERHRELDRLGTKYAVAATAGWVFIAIVAYALLGSTRMSPLPLMMAMEAPAILAYGLFAANRSALLACNRLPIANAAVAGGTVCGVVVVLCWRQALSMPLAFVVASWVQALACLVAAELVCRQRARERLDRQPSLGRLAIAVALSTAASTVDRAAASLLGSGAVTAITVADRLYQLPATVATGALSSAVFPTFARLRSGVEFGRFAEYALALNIAITLPAATAGALFAPEALEIVAGPAFAHSHARSGVVVAIALLFVAVPLYSQSVLYTRVLLGAGAERWVARQGVLAFVLNVVGDLVGALAFGLPGIAAATLLTYVVSDAYLLHHIRRTAWPAASIRAATVGDLGFMPMAAYFVGAACLFALRMNSPGVVADVLLAGGLCAFTTGAMLAVRTTKAGETVRNLVRLVLRRDRPAP